VSDRDSGVPYCPEKAPDGRVCIFGPDHASAYHLDPDGKRWGGVATFTVKVAQSVDLLPSAECVDCGQFWVPDGHADAAAKSHTGTTGHTTRTTQINRTIYQGVTPQ
jgi:hypothetical protein